MRGKWLECIDSFQLSEMTLWSFIGTQPSQEQSPLKQKWKLGIFIFSWRKKQHVPLEHLLQLWVTVTPPLTVTLGFCQCPMGPSRMGHHTQGSPPKIVWSRQWFHTNNLSSDRSHPTWRYCQRGTEPEPGLDLVGTHLLSWSHLSTLHSSQQDTAKYKGDSITWLQLTPSK